MRKILTAAITAVFTFVFGVLAEGGDKYYGASFSANFMIYLLSPDNLVGWNGTLRDYEIKYISEKYQNLPIVGGWYGQGNMPDKEALLSAHITKAVVFYSGDPEESSAASTLKSLDIPVIMLKEDRIADYAVIFRRLGAEFNIKARGEELALYAEDSIKRVKAMLGDNVSKVRVYFAQGRDGLTTICSSSVRAETINISGGEVAHKCVAGGEMTNISFEQLMNYDPDMIFVQEKSFWDELPRSRAWQRLRAVKAGKIYKIPNEPFSWLDRPPSFMRLMGIKWLACKIHPEKCTIDIRKETSDFMKLFFGKELTETEIKAALYE
jgi:iron complex transport system substrate-binding protein